jgi:hypothetical protein
MIYVKGLLAGVAALIVYMALFAAVGVSLLVPKPPSLPDSVGYISNSPWIPLWVILVGALGVFAATAYSVLRRASRVSGSRF